MSEYIEKFCDNFHTLKAKNGIDKRIHFDKNDNEAHFSWSDDLIVSLPFPHNNEINFIVMTKVLQVNFLNSFSLPTVFKKLFMIIID